MSQGPDFLPLRERSASGSHSSRSGQVRCDVSSAPEPKLFMATVWALIPAADMWLLERLGGGQRGRRAGSSGRVDVSGDVMRGPRAAPVLYPAVPTSCGPRGLLLTSGAACCLPCGWHLEITCGPDLVWRQRPPLWVTRPRTAWGSWEGCSHPPTSASTSLITGNVVECRLWN